MAWWRILGSEGTEMRKGRRYLGEQGAVYYGWIQGYVKRLGTEKTGKVHGGSWSKIPGGTEGLTVGCE